MLFADFAGSKMDEQSVADEKDRGCREALARPNPPPPGGFGFLRELIVPLLNFFPSDNRESKGTMLQIVGVVGVKITSASSYISFIDFSVEPYKGSGGNVDGVSMRPAFSGETEFLLRAFRQKNPESIALRQKGGVSFEVHDVTTARLVYARYDIYDRNNQVVAGIEVPLLVPRR
jgi:hypothetical protein